MSSYDEICQHLAKNNANAENGFPGLVGDVCSNYIDKVEENGNPEQLVHDLEVESYINQYGLTMLYRPYLYIEDMTEKVFAEHSGAEYALPFKIKIIIEAKDSPSWFEPIGIVNDETSTAWIHIKTFKNKIEEILRYKTNKLYKDYSKIYDLNYVYNKNYLKAIEPKPKDVIQLTTYGCDREWDRGNRMYEITNVEDEILSENFNFLMGHYVWKLTIKRFRYSNEVGISSLNDKSKEDVLLGENGEQGNHQLSDSGEVIQLINNKETGKAKKEVHQQVYEHDAMECSKETNDMSRNIIDVYKNKLKEIKTDDDGYIDSNGYF